MDSTQPLSVDLPEKVTLVFDEFYGLVASRQPLSSKFINQMRQTNQEIMPLIKAAHEKVRIARKRRGLSGVTFKDVELAE